MQNRTDFKNKAAEFISNELLKTADVKNWEVFFKAITGSAPKYTELFAVNSDIYQFIASCSRKLSAISTVLEVKAASLTRYIKALTDLDILEREILVTEEGLSAGILPSSMKISAGIISAKAALPAGIRKLRFWKGALSHLLF